MIPDNLKLIEKPEVTHFLV